MYENDSFYTLSQGGQLGLLLLSAALGVALLWLGWRLMRSQRRGVALVIAVALFVGFVWLSPQIYYTYYRQIFAGLPAQWVIGWPPILDAVRFATFTGPANLSAHSQGLLFWLLVVLAFRASGARVRSQ